MLDLLAYITEKTSSDQWLFILVFFLGVVSLAGYFCTKTKGYGLFSAATLLIILVLTFSSLMYAAGKISSNEMANIFFAILGFVGGLITANKSTEG